MNRPAGAAEEPGADTPVLLDTHVWIWVAEGDDRRMGPKVVRRIERAAASGRVLIHPMSVWEVGTLVRKGRLTLSGSVEDWVEAALRLPGLFLLDLSPRAALAATTLPADHLTDPVDRMLVAAARIEGAELVTADRRILEFAGEGGVRVRAVSG